MKKKINRKVAFCKKKTLKNIIQITSRKRSHTSIYIIFYNSILLITSYVIFEYLISDII